ncbi:DUF1893 domain-containing protein [Chloroflexota bacterium]
MYSLDEFLTSGDTLQVYDGGTLVFASDKERLLPLMEYIARSSPHHQQVTILDRIVGNAAALLAVIANCQDLYSPLGSELAIKTLDKHNVRHHFAEIVPYIQRLDGKHMCPMEKLSFNKEPEEFYETLRNIIK